jgi:hypothetical protein
MDKRFSELIEALYKSDMLDCAAFSEYAAFLDDYTWADETKTRTLISGNNFRLTLLLKGDFPKFDVVSDSLEDLFTTVYEFTEHITLGNFEDKIGKINKGEFIQDGANKQDTKYTDLFEEVKFD